MEKLGVIDLEIIQVGINNDDKINETNLENSELKRLGVGRLLDELASLQQRNLIKINEDKSFTVTNTAKQILWNKEIPLFVKILRLLQIKSFPIEKILKYIDESRESIQNELDEIRKNGLIMMSPLRVEEKLEKMYEILPEGIEELEKIESKGYQYAGLSKPNTAQNQEIFSLIDEIVQLVQSEPDTIQEKKNEIISKLEQIKKKLAI